MPKDLKINIDNVRLNIRVGVIFRHNNKFVIEISKEGRNSVVPGGRIKINEHSKDALVREINEEMGFVINKNNLSLVKVFENFFKYDLEDVHEIYFLYEYNLTEEEVNIINNLNINYDNETTYFKLINNSDCDKYNLLPLELHSIINK